MRYFKNKNTHRTFIFLCITVSITFNACYYDKGDVVYPVSSAVLCDTSNITYSNQVVSILNTNCNQCHGAATAPSIGANIYLNSYSAVKAVVTSGTFLNSIVQNGKASPMPKNAPKLDNCSILKIQTWINKGALNN